MFNRPTTRLAVLTAALLCTGAAFAADKVQIGNGQMEFPESLSSLSDGTLFFGSLSGGTVLKAAPGATATEDFIAAPADGPKAVLGVLADEASNTLWACYADLSWFAGQQGLPSVLRSYDASSGTLNASYDFTGPSLCNDIAIGADGAAYAADTVAGSVVRTTADGGIETWKQDEMLGGADGLSFGPDGALYVNSVTASKLFRIDVNDDGSAGDITEIATSEPLAGPDGMRFGSDGKLYVANNQSGVATALAIEGDSATVTTLEGTYDSPTAVTQVGDTLWVLEAKIGKFGGTEDPGMFYAYPVSMQ